MFFSSLLQVQQQELAAAGQQRRFQHFLRRAACSHPPKCHLGAKPSRNASPTRQMLSPSGAGLSLTPLHMAMVGSFRKGWGMTSLDAEPCQLHPLWYEICTDGGRASDQLPSLTWKGSADDDLTAEELQPGSQTARTSGRLLPTSSNLFSETPGTGNCLEQANYKRVEGMKRLSTVFRAKPRLCNSISSGRFGFTRTFPSSIAITVACTFGRQSLGT